LRKNPRFDFLVMPACALALGLALLLPLPLPGTRMSEAVQWLAHAAMFGVATWTVRRMTSLRGLTTWIIMAVVAVGSEALQLLVGRNASASDVLHDLYGITAALALHPMHEGIARRRLFLAAGLVVLAAAPLAWNLAAYAQRNARFPTLFRYDSLLDLHFLERSGSSRRLVVPARCADGSLRVPLGPRRFAGILLHEPLPDWRGRDSLEIQLGAGDDEALLLTIRVHDEHHDWRYGDRFNEQVAVRPGRIETIRIPMERIRRAPTGRQMDIARIAGVAIFRAEPGPSTVLCLRSVALDGVGSAGPGGSTVGVDTPRTR
jgi:VanZ family protein